MPKIGFRIRPTKSKSASILVNFRPPSSPPLEVRTGLSTNVSQWSQDKQRSKGRDAPLIDLNRTLSKLSLYLEEAINNSDGVELNNNWLKKSVDRFFNRVEKKDSLYLLNFYADYLKGIKNNKDGSVGLKSNTIKAYVSFYNILIKYENAIDSRLRFDKLNKDAFDDIYSYLLNEEGYTPGHVGRQISRLKTLCRAASGEGIKVNPYHLTHKAKPVHSERFLTIITDKEIKLLENYIPENNYLNNTKSWALIGLSIGQRVSDLLSLTPDQVRAVEPGVVLVDIVQKKTGALVTIPVKNSIVIDILLNHFPSKIANQTFNKFLKLLLKAASINDITTGYLKGENKRQKLVKGPKWMFVSSHDLRRSFATNHYLNGVPTQYLMKMTGHLRESSFLLYIGKSANKDEDALTFLKYL
jgi:integrase